MNVAYTSHRHRYPAQVWVIKYSLYTLFTILSDTL